MKTKLKTFLSCLVLAAMIFTMTFGFIACDDPVDPNTPTGPTGINNETTRLVLSTAEMDGVFNPFYSSAAADSNIVGMTQISMLAADKNGNIIGYTTPQTRIAALAAEPCVVYDYDEYTYTENGDQFTRYRFVLKNNVKFSNGSPLTMKDVLFNLYEYLDPAYYGSATIYSTEIVGLKEYQTQTRSQREQDKFNERFDAEALSRIEQLTIDAINDIRDDTSNRSLTDAEMTELLKAWQQKHTSPLSQHVVEDYGYAKAYFRKELETDYTNSVDTAKDIKFMAADGVTEVCLTTDTEAFLYNEGKITWDEKNHKFEYSFGEASKNWTREEAVQRMYDSYVPNSIDEVINMWNTGNELRQYLANKLKKEYFDNMDEDERIQNISGIKFINRTEAVEVNGNTYAPVTAYNADGSVVTTCHEVLEITIEKVDPKAIWNFAFTVAPMYYYSNSDQIAAFDYEKNFGIDFGSPDFQDKVIKDSSKIGVPVGAGPYKATTQSGDSSNVQAGTFRSNGVVYFERNEHFMFPAKIKYVNYQVVSTNSMLDTLYSGDVHFVEPSCTQDIINDIEQHKQNGTAVDYDKVETNGYGYVGINAEKIPDVNVRRAIMHAINTQLCVDYYHGYSQAIYRPMTRVSWAYPDEVNDMHAEGSQTKDEHYYEFDPEATIIKELVKDYSLNAQGILQKGNTVLKFTFTIAGESTDHPAYMALTKAAAILNGVGFKVNVATDIRALSKLSSGDLTVWAAAWGAAIDPDMYQVYHKDSTAGSTSNWGYRAILRNAGGKYDYEYGIVQQLSVLIDEARETTDQNERKERYAEALDLVMDLAVELPTYQRSDLFAFNTNIIDADTLQHGADLTAYNGPLARLWEVSLKESK